MRKSFAISNLHAESPHRGRTQTDRRWRRKVETADAKKVAVALYIAFFVNDQKGVLATVRTKQQVWRQNYILQFETEILSPLFLVRILTL